VHQFAKSKQKQHQQQARSSRAIKCSEVQTIGEEGQENVEEIIVEGE